MKITQNILLVIGFSLLFPDFFLSQEIGDSSLNYTPGRVYTFRMGKLNENVFQSTISFRTDDILGKKIALSGKSLSIDNPYFYRDKGWNEDNIIDEYSFKINKNGTIENDRFLNVDGVYKKKSSGKNLLALGNVELNTSACSRVRYLSIAPSLGYTDLKKFKNLKAISIEYSRSDYLYIEADSGVDAVLKYPGDPFLLKNILDINMLEFLRIDMDDKHFNRNFSGNIYLIDGLDESIFQNKKLKALYTNGVSFLPIDYEGIKQLEYLELNNIRTPEVLNIALLFYKAGKDTSIGTWNHYVQSLVDIEKSNVDVITGEVKSYYKNGGLISHGEMIENKPHGTWEFWYPDGQLCQVRHYDNGVRIGKWIFLESSEFSIDTTLILEYNNGELIHRVDKSIEYTFFEEAECNSSEKSVQALHISEYTINKNDEDKSEIIKRTSILGSYWSNEDELMVNDTLKGHVENIKFESNKWTYSIKEYCLGSIQGENIQTGILRKLPYKLSDFGVLNTDGIQKTRKDLIINLEDCTWELIQYSRDKEGVLNLKNKILNNIQPIYWPCN